METTKVSMNIESSMKEQVNERMKQFKDSTGIDLTFSSYVRSLIKKDLDKNLKIIKPLSKVAKDIKYKIMNITPESDFDMIVLTNKLGDESQYLAAKVITWMMERHDIAVTVACDDPINDEFRRIFTQSYINDMEIRKDKIRIQNNVVIRFCDNHKNIPPETDLLYIPNTLSNPTLWYTAKEKPRMMAFIPDTEHDNILSSISIEKATKTFSIS